MKKHKLVLAGLLSVGGFTFGIAQADTILSVTETHYDINLRADCMALRMNATTFADPPSNACTPKTTVGTNGPDRITQTVYDNAGQVKAVYRAIGTSSIIQYAYYDYTINGKKAYEIDANHNKTTFTYDGLDRLSKIQYPNTTAGNEVSSTTDIEQFAYDANNNKTWWKRRNGIYIYYNYDNLNRQVLTYPGDSSVPNLYTGYDLQGHILYKRFNGTGVSTANPDVTYTYDAMGRGTATKDANARTVAYNYDEASKRLRMFFPDSANYVYYNRDYLGRVTGTNFGGVSEYLYQQTFDSRGFPYTLTRGNSAVGGTTSYTVDAIGRMSGLAINIDGTTTTHDATWTFTRNPAGQVYSWTSTGPYDYVETATSTVAKTYDGLNRDAAIAAVSGGYDANGNVTKDASRVMKYDVYNRLLSVAAIATPTVPYMTLTYDTEGRLSAVITTAGTKEFLYDGTNLIGEYTHVGSSSTVHTSDTMAARYIHGESTDQPLVWYASSAITAPQYLFANYQGSIIAYTNAAGAFSESYHYDPYGNPVNPTGGVYWYGSRFRFTGQIALPDAYLYYYKARVYDPAAGRFLQTDPVGSKDDLDIYAYVGGDPVNKNDPTGLASCAGNISDDQCEAALAQQKKVADTLNTARNLLIMYRQERDAVASGDQDSLSETSQNTENALNKYMKGTDNGTIDRLLDKIKDIRIRTDSSQYIITANMEDNVNLGNTVPMSNWITLGSKWFTANDQDKQVTQMHEWLHTSGVAGLTEVYDFQANFFTIPNWYTKNNADSMANFYYKIGSGSGN
jgi:RHS repeat-associated protein